MEMQARQRLYNGTTTTPRALALVISAAILLTSATFAHADGEPPAWIRGISLAVNPRDSYGFGDQSPNGDKGISVGARGHLSRRTGSLLELGVGLDYTYGTGYQHDDAPNRADLHVVALPLTVALIAFDKPRRRIGADVRLETSLGPALLLLFDDGKSHVAAGVQWEISLGYTHAVSDAVGLVFTAAVRTDLLFGLGVHTAGGMGTHSQAGFRVGVCWR